VECKEKLCKDKCEAILNDGNYKATAFTITTFKLMRKSFIKYLLNANFQKTKE
jgi:predicted nucleic acid-binding Zn ribbon protein